MVSTLYDGLVNIGVVGYTSYNDKKKSCLSAKNLDFLFYSRNFLLLGNE